MPGLSIKLVVCQFMGKFMFMDSLVVFMFKLLLLICTQKWVI